MKKYQGFDLLAPFYDSLASLVFGNTLKKAQIEFLSHIPENARILIAGGGTGWQLIELIKRKPSCQIVYVEASSKMLELTQKKLKKTKLHNSANVLLLLDPFYIENSKQEFDVVITSFFLDVFNKSSLEKIISSLENLLKTQGLWLLADFDKRECEKSLPKKLLIKCMYFFFRITSCLEGRQLYDFDKILISEKLQKLESKKYYAGMVFSAIYKKS